MALLLLLFIHRSAHAQNAWVLQKDKEGIRISSRHAANSSFNDVRVEMDLPGTLDQLAAILLNIPAYTEWAYATKKSILIKVLAPGKLIYYSEISVPWPATNRCFYASFEMKRDTQYGTLQLISASIPDYKPVPKDLVQLPFSKGTWKVKTISAKSIHIDYTLELDPGGSLPAWILNLFTTKGPWETFENIKRKMTALNP